VARLYLALAWREKGESGKAIEELLRIDPASEEFRMAMQTLTALYIKEGRVDEGLSTLKSLLAANRGSQEIYLMLAVLYEEKEDFDEAVRMVEAARSLGPDSPEVIYQLGMLYEKKGDTARALSFMEEVLKNEPQHANALNFVGYTLAEQGINLDKAEEMVRKALELKPGEGYIIDSLGWVYFKKGNYRAALEELLKAHEALPEDPTIAEHVADVYVALSDKEKAISFYERARDLEKKDDKRKALEKKIDGLRGGK
jgi:tetratricopeptide (TPR) repeat protein